jgi:hypothetical protein
MECPPPKELPQTAIGFRRRRDDSSPSDGGIPVGELSLDRQQLAGLTAAVAEVPIGEGQGGDTGLREPLGEGIQAHLACRAETVPRMTTGGEVLQSGR